MSKCSSTGPRLSAGKNVSAPTIRITPISKTVNRGVVTGKVPRDGGTYFFWARLPAMASMGMIIKKRPTSMVTAPETLYQLVLPFSPPNADPLLPACETNEYRISLSPCGPGFAMLDVPNEDTVEIALNTKITVGKISVTSIAIFTSYASIFLPRYSGVRPTINPAIKTESTI